MFPALLEAGKPLYGFPCEGYWEDVGTLEAYGKAHQDVLDGKVEIDIPGFRVGEGVWLGEGSEVDPAARIEGPVILGDYCKVDAGAHIRDVGELQQALHRPVLAIRPVQNRKHNVESLRFGVVCIEFHESIA